MLMRKLLLLLLIVGVSLGLTVNLGGCPLDSLLPTPDNGDVDDGGDDGADDGDDTDDGADDGDGDDADDGDDDADDGDDDDGDDGTAMTRHQLIFTEIVPEGYEGPASCLLCHTNVALDLIEKAHWLWEGEVDNIVGLEGETHGKQDLINNFCIAVPSNEGRCSQCHPSYGWTDNTFDFTSTDNIDCLICHDTTGTYKKHPSANGGGGQPAMMVDGELTVVTAADLQQVAYNVGEPTRQNCGACHFFAGGGDNVKHGDLSSDLVSPTAEMDYHMGTFDFTCQDCHTTTNHGIAGMVLHSSDEGGGWPTCTGTCHDATAPHQEDALLAQILNRHIDRIACVTCHIPTFARSKPTKVEWYWDEAGQDIDPIPTDEFGMATYDKKKGRFVWDMNVAPTLMWYNHKWERMVLGAADTYDEAGTVDDPVVIAKPTATIDDEDAKIYPFKKMIGTQPADTANQRLIVPHLFGTATGDNPYWGNYEWAPALQDGADYAGQPFDSSTWSAEDGFVNTVMYLTVNHEVAAADQALTCDECHGVEGFFEALGYPEGDPLE